MLTHTHSPVALSHLLSFPLLCTTQDGMTSELSLQLISRYDCLQ